jgi:GNAT superfamily N-acetyltransferase
VAAAPGHSDALAALFARADVACHCRYWHFVGTTNDWLARCAHEPEVNRAEMTAALEAGTGEMSGMVALEGDRAIGWLKLSAAAQVDKLYAQRVYRRLPCFDGDREGVLTVGCLLVDPERRRTGVARALLQAAVAHAAALGARAIEAFPRRAEDLRDADVFMGPFAMFAREGFEIVNDFGPYPVMRKALPRDSVSSPTRPPGA